MFKTILLLLTLTLLMTCSRQKTEPAYRYMPDMANSPAVRAQEYDPSAPFDRAMRLPPDGTVPVDFQPYPYGPDDSLLASNLVNPLPRTMEVMTIGRKYYNNICIVCHGGRGTGDGYIVPKFPAPPSLLDEHAIELTDGRIFHVITVGQGFMPSYHAQLRPAQRWAVVHYIRVLQRAGHPTQEDLADFDTTLITLESDLPDTARRVLWPGE